ncbi:MAG: divalent-cation tolerance protein CutA [Myxococcota bacterium]|jgi:periplasmic divalent cation tolerance protein|nr:divalent-cation tolerance protein CutA [Myxococcota bacterium]
MNEANSGDSASCVVLCTCPDETVATRIATTVVEHRLAACVNRVPGVESIYHWEGRVERDREDLLVIKTTAARYAELEACIREVHPNDVPEVIALPIERGSRDYLAWISESVS